jgi:hypothetical protein
MNGSTPDEYGHSRLKPMMPVVSKPHIIGAKPRHLLVVLDLAHLGQELPKPRLDLDQLLPRQVFLKDRVHD